MAQIMFSAQTTIVTAIAIILLSIITAEANWNCTCKTTAYDYTYDVCTEVSGRHPSWDSKEPMICDIDSSRRYRSFKSICVHTGLADQDRHRSS
ncbi:hypothetical protein BGZ68_001385 [Mortierella alpina]|nr:hypothetical protein BGZ68_001385 [Mortierella alpina]